MLIKRLRSLSQILPFKLQDSRCLSLQKEQPVDLVDQPRTHRRSVSVKFKRISLQVPDGLSSVQLRRIFEAKDHESIHLQGIRWFYEPHDRLVTIEGRPGKRYDNAVETIQSRLQAAA